MSPDKPTKLELTWIGKDEQPRLEPRILLEDPTKSYHADRRVTEHDIFDNRLIFGDNLLALKALEQEFTGRVKCVVLDPPYNTGAAFSHYDDGVEHSLWLSLIKARLEIIRHLLRTDGSLWICIDDNEGHYLKVLCDEVFGRSGFLASIAWQHSVQGKGYSGKFSVHHNYILVYQRSPSFQLKDLPREEKHNVHYSNPDNDPNGPWRAGDIRNAMLRPNLIYNIMTPSGKVIAPPKKGWRFSRETMAKKIQSGEVYFRKGETKVGYKIYLQNQGGRVPETLWFGEDVGTTREAMAESKALFGGGERFPTPKPERLVQRILTLATEPGDVVLDSFAGSGTTGAVAHKMGRHWIMIELGDHCQTHIIPRVRKVIDGGDLGGITDAVGWKGGGGFRYYRLASSLLERDRWGNWVVSKEYSPAMLAQAMCKHEGFKYSPSDSVYWMHGRSTERDFIFVTTQTLTRSQLISLSEDVGSNRTLLVCCGAFQGKADAYSNLTLKKIPKAVLHRCEWGRDDYSLKIAALPPMEPPDDEGPQRRTAKRKAANGGELPLFKKEAR